MHPTLGVLSRFFSRRQESEDKRVVLTIDTHTLRGYSKAIVTPEIPIEQFEIFASGVDHSECIAFDRDGNLWAGGEGGQIYRIGPDQKPEIIADLCSFSAGIAFSPVEEDLFVCNPSLGIVRVKKNGK